MMLRGVLPSTACHCLTLHVVSAVTLFERPNGCLRSIYHAYLPQNRLHMDLDRRVGNTARTSDHLVGMAPYHAFEDLLLALRQTVRNSNRNGAVNDTILRLVALCHIFGIQVQ